MRIDVKLADGGVLGGEAGVAAESGKHSGSMSAFVPFFISSATFSYVSTGNLDLLVLICVVPQHPSLSFLFQPRDRSTSPTLRHPPCFLRIFNQETGWVASIYYFPLFPLRTKS